MKNNYKNLLALGIPLVLVSSVQAQSNTLFEFEDSVDRWGVWQAGTQATGYEGNFTGYTNTDVDLRNGIQANEGVIDGSGAIFEHRQAIGASTWISDGVDGGAAASGLALDLTTVGSSVQFQFTNFLLANTNATGGTAYSNNFSLFEIGVTSGSDIFGSSADSFFLAGAPTSVTAEPGFSDVTGTFDLVAHDETSVNSTAGVVGTALATLESGLTLDSVGVNGGSSGPTHGTGIAYTYDITLTNAGNGNFDIDYVLNEFTINDVRADLGIDPIFEGTTSGSTTVAHGLTDLDALNIGVGFRTLDSNVPVSGATFDSFAELNALAIPEPSSTLLLGLSSLLFLGHRRRK